MSSNQTKALHQELENKKICRYCLVQDDQTLTGIFDAAKSSAPLLTQSTAIAAIEIGLDDGMPSFICMECRLIFEYCYRFRQMCKKAETLLRQFPLVGVWPEKLKKPEIPEELIRKKFQPRSASQAAANGVGKVFSQQRQQPMHILNKVPAKVPQTSSPPKKLLNSQTISQVKPIIMKLESEDLQEDYDGQNTIFLLNETGDNGTEIAYDDVRNFISTAPGESFIFEADHSPPTASKSFSKPLHTPVESAPRRPKLLNKNSMRILNKDANVVMEPRLSKPQVTEDEHGNLALVTEILDPKAPHEPEPDPTQNVPTIETHIFPCPHCDRSFPLRQLRDIHLVNHTRERSFKCGSCEKSFFSKYDLQKHEVIHSDDKPFKCTVCDKGFTRSNLLHRHEKSHTDTPKYLCVYCEQQFISKEEMEKHTERHLKNRPFKCRLCSKSFAFKQGLERHEVKHQSQQPYPCQYCKQSFATPSKLQRHLTAHAGKRPYPCKYCMKSFMLSHHLTRHMRGHKQSKSTHKCTVCAKSFKNVEELFYHTYVHSIEMGECVLCSHPFTDEDRGGDHIKAHVESDPNFCEFCEMIFINEIDLAEHKADVHAEDVKRYDAELSGQSAADSNHQQADSAENLNDDLDPVMDDLIGDIDVGDLEEITVIAPSNQQKPNDRGLRSRGENIMDMMASHRNLQEEQVAITGEEEEEESILILDNEEPPVKVRRTTASGVSRLQTPASKANKVQIQSQEIFVSSPTRFQQKRIKEDPKDAKASALKVQEKILAALPKSITLRKTGAAALDKSPPKTPVASPPGTKDNLSRSGSKTPPTQQTKLLNARAAFSTGGKRTLVASRQKLLVPEEEPQSLKSARPSAPSAARAPATQQKTQPAAKTKLSNKLSPPLRLTEAQLEDLKKQGKLIIKRAR